MTRAFEKDVFSSFDSDKLQRAFPGYWLQFSGSCVGLHGNIIKGVPGICVAFLSPLDNATKAEEAVAVHLVRSFADTWQHSALWIVYTTGDPAREKRWISCFILTREENPSGWKSNTKDAYQVGMNRVFRRESARGSW
jgi:hypothetical protein